MSDEGKPGEEPKDSLATGATSIAPSPPPAAPKPKKAKRKRASSAAPPLPLIFVADAIGLILSTGPGIVAWSTGAFYLLTGWSRGGAYRWGALATFLPLVVATFLVTLLTLRLLCPRQRTGVFTFSTPNLGVASWQCALALSRAARAAGLMAVFHSFYILRFFYYRALGAKLALRTNMALDCFLVDAQLLRIDEDATISFGTLVCAHTVLGDKLVMMTVDIGREVFIGSNCVIGAGAKIGDNAYIGMRNQVYNVTVEPNRRIEPHEWEHGPKGTGAEQAATA